MGDQVKPSRHAPLAWAIGDIPESSGLISSLSHAYRNRLRRRRFLLLAFRRRRELEPVADRTAAIRKGDVLCFACVRNEAQRLPHFLAHNRSLGVRHFLVVDNDSTDSTARLLDDQPDISVWRTRASYKASRFGMDWLTWLMLRHGHGHWCLTLDADEILFAPVRQLLFRTEPPHPDPARHAEHVAAGKAAEGVIEARFADLDRQLGDQDFFCGSLSVADIGLFMTILFTQRLKGPALLPHKGLAAWYQRLLARPAFAKAAREIAAADRELSPALAGG